MTLPSNLPTRAFDPSVVGPLRVLLTQDHRFRQRALAVPGAYYNREIRWYVVENPTPRAAAATIALFPEALVEHPELTQIRDRDYGNARPHDYASELQMDLGEFATLGGNVKLYGWQNSDGAYLTAIAERDGGAHFAWDRGMGKTVITAAAIKRLNAKRTIVVARNDAKEAVWLKQLKEKPGLLPDAHVIVLENVKTKREKQLAWIAEHKDEPVVFVIHYEAIALIAGPKIVEHRSKDGQEAEPPTVTKAGGKGWDKLGDWDLLVFDESHRLAHYNPNSSKNTQMGRALSYLRREHVRIVLDLSGSTIMNHPEDMFGQLHLMFPKIYRAKWRDWNDRFIDYVDDGSHKVPIGFKYETLDELRKELGVFMVYRTKKEVFDLPPLIEQDVELHLYPEQQRIYDEVRDQFWSRLEEGGIKAVNPLDQINKLRRIATYYPGVPSVKLDYTLHELEESPDDQFVIFTWFKEPGHALAERLGDDVIVVDGDVQPKHRPELLARHEKGLARILVGSIATIGESLNLQYMHEAIRLDRDWNPQVNAQATDRLNRHGQQQRVTFRDLWAVGTVDTLRVRPRLASKESMRKAVFG